MNQDEVSPPRVPMRGVASGLEQLGYFYLLGMPGVQAELGLSKPQLDRILAINKERSRELDLLLEDRQKFDVLKKVVAEKADGAMLATLTSEQQKRLSQVALQGKGLFEALTEPGFQSRVGLREPQKDRWSQLLGASRSKERRLVRERSVFLMKQRVKTSDADAGTKVAARQFHAWDAVGLSQADYVKLQGFDAQIEALRIETAKQFIRSLDGSQQATIRELIGRPFDFGAVVKGAAAR